MSALVPVYVSACVMEELGKSDCAAAALILGAVAGATVRITFSLRSRCPWPQRGYRLSKPAVRRRRACVETFWKSQWPSLCGGEQNRPGRVPPTVQWGRGRFIARLLNGRPTSAAALTLGPLEMTCGAGARSG